MPNRAGSEDAGSSSLDQISLFLRFYRNLWSALVKLSLGMKLQSGPWGGGNQVGHALAEYLQNKGVKLFFDLIEPDLDLIVLTEPRTNLKSSAFSHKDVLKYLWRKNWQAVVVYRINNSSEARDDETKSYNKFGIAAGKVADHTIFISQWLYDRYVEAGFNSPNYSIILNGGDSCIWQRKPRAKPGSKLKIVTHHWSNNAQKGFDIYQQLDDLLASPAWAEQVAFTYIGRVPDDFHFKNSKHLEPLSGQELVAEIQKHDIYLTAAQNEAAGMHHIEGALCGLPLLYRESGGIPEYGRGFGVSFTAENFSQKLQEMLSTYNHWLERMQDYPHTAERMCETYYHLFQELLQQRDEILKRRRFWRNPIWLARTLLG